MTRRAEKQLRDLAPALRRRVKVKLLSLEEDPYKPSTKLAQLPGFRIRVGDYRILCNIDDKEKLVRISQISHRREAYR